MIEKEENFQTSQIGGFLWINLEIKAMLLIMKGQFNLSLVNKA